MRSELGRFRWEKVKTSWDLVWWPGNCMERGMTAPKWGLVGSSGVVQVGFAAHQAGLMGFGGGRKWRQRMMIFPIPGCRELVFSNAFPWSFPWSYQEAVGCHRAGIEPVGGNEDLS